MRTENILHNKHTVHTHTKKDMLQSVHEMWQRLKKKKSIQRQQWEKKSAHQTHKVQPMDLKELAGSKQPSSQPPRAGVVNWWMCASFVNPSNRSDWSIDWLIEHLSLTDDQNVVHLPEYKNRTKRGYYDLSTFHSFHLRSCCWESFTRWAKLSPDLISYCLYGVGHTPHKLKKSSVLCCLGKILPVLLTAKGWSNSFCRE